MDTYRGCTSRLDKVEAFEADPLPDRLMDVAERPFWLWARQ